MSCEKNSCELFKYLFGTPGGSRQLIKTSQSRAEKKTQTFFDCVESQEMDYAFMSSDIIWCYTNLWFLNLNLTAIKCYYLLNDRSMLECSFKVPVAQLLNACGMALATPRSWLGKTQTDALNAKYGMP